MWCGHCAGGMKRSFFFFSFFFSFSFSFFLFFIFFPITFPTIIFSISLGLYLLRQLVSLISGISGISGVSDGLKIMCHAIMIGSKIGREKIYSFLSENIRDWIKPPSLPPIPAEEGARDEWCWKEGGYTLPWAFLFFLDTAAHRKMRKTWQILNLIKVHGFLSKMHIPVSDLQYLQNWVSCGKPAILSPRGYFSICRNVVTLGVANLHSVKSTFTNGISFSSIPLRRIT